jgi:crotonobetainyl-CoA:carnitine CoA-transferase CaiB-like acyl-CoA transferase
VVDLSAFAVGPWAASLLAALGADVVKIDPPYGDHIRRVKPARHGEATTYTVCNLGKRSIELDLKNPEQRAVAHELVAECDVVVENSREGAMDRLGMGYRTLREINPRLVYCASSSFGSTGPLATVGSTDPQGQAFSGFVSIQGDQGGVPELLRYFAVVDLGTSACLAQAALIGLHRRARTGTGCVVKTSQLEGALAVQATRLAEHLVAGATPVPMGSGCTAVVPSQAFTCRDRRTLTVSAADEPSWRRLCAALERPGLADDPRFATNRDRVDHRAELVEVLAEVFAQADAVWWRGRLRRLRVAHATPLDLDDLMRGTGPRLTEEFLVELPHPVRGRIRAVRPPWRFSRTPEALAVAPLPGQHNDQLLGRPDPASAREQGQAAPVAPDAADTPPLAGVRVLELAQGISGPYCGMLLRALGAEVTKAELGSGDLARGWAPLDPATGDSAVFRALNRGKRGLRLAGPLDGAVAAGEPDVVLVDAHLEGLDPDEVERFVSERVRRGAVVCRLSAVGDGPGTDASMAGATELEIQALGGLTRYLGAVGDPPVRVGADLAMTLCGAFGLQGVLAGLLERRSSGKGQVVDVSALGALLSVMTVMTSALDDPDEWSGFHLLAAGDPRDHGVRTSDGAVAFSAPRRSDEAWYALCRELGADALAADERFQRDAQRTPRSKELARELGRYTGSLTTATVLEATHRHGGLATAVQTYPEVLEHPQVKAMDVCDTAGGCSSLAAPWRIDGERPHIEEGT